MGDHEPKRGDALEIANHQLRRRVRALQALVNDQFYSLIEFCVALPLRGKALSEQLLRDLAGLHTKNSIHSDLFADRDDPRFREKDARGALELVWNIHVSEGVMEEGWASLEGDEDRFTVHYDFENCFYNGHCKDLICNGIECQCVRRLFY